MVAGCSLALQSLSVDTGTGGGGFLDFRTDTTGGTDLLAMRLITAKTCFYLTNRQALSVMQTYATARAQDK